MWAATTTREYACIRFNTLETAPVNCDILGKWARQTSGGFGSSVLGSVTIYPVLSQLGFQTTGVYSVNSVPNNPSQLI